jgi:hypothetical protein
MVPVVAAATMANKDLSGIKFLVAHNMKRLSSRNEIGE